MRTEAPRHRLLLAAAAALAAGRTTALAQPVDSSFVFRAELADAGVPAAGTFDMQFRLFDAPAGGAQIGPQICANDLIASAGRVSTTLNFGSVFGASRLYLEVVVRRDTGSDCADPSGWTTLLPRQPIETAPYAAYSLSSATATSAGNTLLFGGQDSTFYRNAANLNGTLASTSLAGTYSSSLTFDNASNVLAGNGAALTALNAGALSSGLIPSARLSGTYSSPLTLSNASNVLSGNGAGITSINAAALSTGLVPSARLSGPYSSALTFSNAANTFIGNGSGLTALNAAAITTGGLPDARLSTNVAMRNESNTFAVGPHVFTGLVGIGRTPAVDLDIQGSTLERFTVDVQSAGLVRVGNLGNESVFSLVSRGSSEIVLDSNNNGATSVFKVLRNGGSESAASVELMRVQESGQVGIGIATPDDTSLHVFTDTRTAAATVETALAGGVGLSVLSTATTGTGIAASIIVNSNDATGLYSRAEANSGVTYAVSASNDSGTANAMAVRGEATRSGANFGIYGSAAGASSFGVYANGRLGSSGTKSFMIDHPLDPENKYLLHYSMESPDVLNVYTGIANLDAGGEAWITLPDYFEAINTEPRYLLTSIGAPAPMLHVAVEIEKNTFKIAGGAPNAKVSWEIKARRNDRFVQRNGAPVERMKIEGEKGLYLQPELYDLPATKSQFHSVVPPATR